MPLERSQFAVLFRDSLSRIVDLELLSTAGEMRTLLVQFVALLAAFSFVCAITLLPRYGTSMLPRSALLVYAWNDEEFLIATTIAVTGLFTLVAWNVVLPDRRDCFVLGLLPIRIRTMMLARLAAIGSGLGLTILAVNLFTGLGYPFFLGGRSAFAYWATVTAAGWFTCCALLSAQAFLVHFLPYRLFLRAAAVLQLAAFCLILSTYFLKPALANPDALAASDNACLLAWLPSYWFLGLFQVLNGPMHAAFYGLAKRAVWALSIATGLAVVTYIPAYYRVVARTLEEPDIAPANRLRLISRIVRWFVETFYRRALDRAILLFIGRSIARSRQHRLLLALYGGVGLAIALAYASPMFHGSSSWRAPGTSLLAASVSLLFFSVVGTRAVFAFPLSLRSNWIFQITAVHRPASYFAAIRRSLFAIGAIPVWTIASVAVFLLWPRRSALQHMAVLVLLGMILVERSLYRFQKIPFACSYLPGKANLNVTLGIYAILFLFLSDSAVRVEFWAMSRLARCVVLVAVLTVSAVWMRRRTAAFANSPNYQIQFEESPSAEITLLDLQGAIADAQESYIDAPCDRRRGLGARLKPVAVAFVILALGMMYEQLSQRSDHRRFPQIGHSVDIGGRSLNLYCSGQGSPTVILESGHSQPGYSWVMIQRELAKTTRTCWYDRAGNGWSDPGPDPSWSVEIARDLHKLLEVERIRPPYVLVGHSMGGYNIRVYRRLYPAEVAGMVLVDASHEDTGTRIPNMPRQFVPDIPRFIPLLLMRGLGAIGFIRLMAPDPGPPPNGMTEEEWATITALRWQAKAQVAQLQEGPLRESAKQVRTAGALGDIPLVVLTAGQLAEPPSTRLEAMESADIQQRWIELQAELAQLSTCGSQEVVGSDHNIPIHAPIAVINAVREVIAKRCQGRGD
jgi:pimeloyl-ACP methyl ester carboxylesterase